MYLQLLYVMQDLYSACPTDLCGTGRTRHDLDNLDHIPVVLVQYIVQDL